jgi:hypothetical protein
MNRGLEGQETGDIQDKILHRSLGIHLTNDEGRMKTFSPLHSALNRSYWEPTYKSPIAKNLSPLFNAWLRHMASCSTGTRPHYRYSPLFCFPPCILQLFPCLLLLLPQELECKFVSGTRHVVCRAIRLALCPLALAHRSDSRIQLLPRLCAPSSEWTQAGMRLQ